MKSLPQTSILNARSPCFLSLCSLLIAATVPSAKTPLYTTPNPPLPITFASLKLSVANSSSLYVKTWTPLYLLGVESRRFPPLRHRPFTSAPFSNTPRSKFCEGELEKLTSFHTQCVTLLPNHVTSSNTKYDIYPASEIE